MNMFSKSFILGIFWAMNCAFAQADTELVSPKEASTLTSEKKAVIVDVREDDEWNGGHIAGAIHIPLNQLDARLPELKQYKDTTIITQCKSGGRSAKALDVLKSAGFSKVYSMDGGIVAWNKDGLATQQK
ncbi:MAG: rhodanese-like domain-containing protein [Methylococcaceae bacterium]|nr:rhodanese-like domain-containing protein [Methylococcaceae bacterium]